VKTKPLVEKKKRKYLWTYFKEMYIELKKVTWPTKEELRNYSICVVSFVLACAIIIGIMDLGLSALMQWLSGTTATDLPTLLKGLIG